MLAKFSVKKPYTVIVAILLVIALGVISFMNMTTDLLPSMDLPYVIVYTTYTGATPEAVESDVTRPLEASFSTLTDVKNVTSTSSENLSLVVMEFEAGADMNTAMIEINSDIEQIRGGWDDEVGMPVIMKLNPDMLPVSISTVSLDDADLLELSDYVEDELISKYEAVDGVARVTASGVLTQQVDITIEQSRIDAINNAILREIDDELADVELQLRDAQSQLSTGKNQLASMRSQVYGQIDEAIKAIDEGSKQLPGAIAELTAQRDELTEQKAQLDAALTQMDQLMAAPEMVQAAQAAGAQMATLQGTRAELEDALSSSEDAASALEHQLLDAQNSLGEERSLHQRLIDYMNYLRTRNPDSLRQTIEQLDADIAANEASLQAARDEYEQAVADEAASQQEMDELRALIEAKGGTVKADAASDAEEVPPEAEPSPSASADATADPDATVDPEATPDAENAPGTESTSDAENTPDAESTPDAEGTPDAENTPDAEGTPDAENTPDAEGTPDAENTPDAEGTPDAESTPDAENTPGTESTPDADADAPGSDSMDGEANAPDGDADSASDANFSDGNAESASDTNSSDENADSASDAKPSDENAESSTDDAPKPQGEPAAQNSAPEPADMPVVNDIPRDAEPDAKEQEEIALLDKLFGGAAQAEEEGGDGETLEQLQQRYEAAKARNERANTDKQRLDERITNLNATLDEQRAAREDAQAALQLLEDEDAQQDFHMELDEAQAQLEACEGRIEALQAKVAELTAALESGTERDQLMKQLIECNQSIEALSENPLYQAYLLLTDDPEAQRATLQAASDQLDAGAAQMDAMLEKLNKGILPGGFIEGIDQDTNLADARGQLVSARGQAASGFSQAASALNDAEAQLSEAWKEFTDNRDEALENAGIDGIITTQTISQILGSQNLDLPAGYVANADDRYLVSVGTEFASIAELRQIKLFSLGMETVNDVRLFDVAKVEISDNSADLFTFVNGENGIMLSFEKQSTASTAEVAENITAESEKLMAENERLHVTEVMNQGDYINLIVDSVLQNLLYGGGLAILVLLLFLLDWRPTLIVAISIPASVVVAFVCMYFAHITLNVMSLSGLALGVGMLVDNSIVSIENIYRLRDEEGLPILTASIRGVNQVAGALFASTLTTICVFLPVVFVEGMARDLFTDMGLTIAFSLLASLVVAMTVVPTAAATLFKKKKVRKQRIFGAVQRGYVVLLRGALRVKPLVLLAAVALLVYSGYQVLDMGISFMPSVNSEQMSASLEFKDAEMPDSEREAEAISIMDEIMQVPGVRDVALSGSSSLSLMGGGSGYTYYILVDTEAGRKNAEIANDMIARAASYADGERSVFSAQVSTMDLSIFAGEGITVDIAGDDIQSLRDAAVDVAAICAQVDGAVNVDDGAEEAEPKMALIVDKELASDNSLSVAQVYQYVAQRLFGAVELTDATLDGREYTLYVNEDKNIDLKPEDVANMEIEVEGTTETHFVRIGDIAEVVDGESLSSIRRDNQQRVTSVSFEVADGYSANLVSRDLEAKLAGYQPPEGVEISLSGENETVMGYMKDLLTMLLIAILFIFLIMVAQFQSFKSPIIVMFTIPLAFTGGLLALLITGMDLSIIAMVGFLVLSGVVVNNGIVFIDSVNQMRINGMEKREALLETGRIRLRPILMTALTTILGMSTMAMAKGMGAEMMQPMAVVTIGGLSYATLMTLFVVPVLYDLLNGKKMKAREIEMMKEAAGIHREGFDDDAPVAVAAEKVETVPAPEAAVEATEPEAPAPAVETPAPEPEPEPEPEPAKAEKPAEPRPTAKPLRVRIRR